MRRDNAPLGWAGWGSLASLWEPPGDGGWGFREEVGNGRGAKGASRLGGGGGRGLGPRREEELERTTAGDLPLPNGAHGRKLSLVSVNPLGGNPWQGTECSDGSRFY